MHFKKQFNFKYWEFWSDVLKQTQIKVIVKVVPASLTSCSLFVLGCHAYTIAMYQGYINSHNCFQECCKTFHGVVGHVCWLMINFVGSALDFRQVEVRQHGQTTSSVCTSRWLDDSQVQLGCCRAAHPSSGVPILCKPIQCKRSLHPASAYRKFTYTSSKKISTDETDGLL